MHGTFYWNELMTRNPAKAKDFYAKTLGWTYEPMATPPGAPAYYLIKLHGKNVGGIFDISGAEFQKAAEGWFAYIEVDDVDARIEKLKAAGGSVIREPWDTPGVGRIAMVSDSNGALQGWMVPVPATVPA